MAKTKERVRDAAETARPYVGRAIYDKEFRDSLRAAFRAARAIYEELASASGATGVASKAATDEQIHKNLRRAIAELRQAADRLQAEQDESHTLRNAFVLLTGVLVGLFFNPYTGAKTRGWIGDRVKGSGDEFAHPNGASDPAGSSGRDEPQQSP
jgi:hypothetical protein